MILTLLRLITFLGQIESVKYAALAITNTIKATSETAIYIKKLSLEALRFYKSFRCLSKFYYIKIQGLQNYLYNLTPSRVSSNATCSFDQTETCHCRKMSRFSTTQCGYLQDFQVFVNKMFFVSTTFDTIKILKYFIKTSIK